MSSYFLSAVRKIFCPESPGDVDEGYQNRYLIIKIAGQRKRNPQNMKGQLHDVSPPIVKVFSLGLISSYESPFSSSFASSDQP
jgi:hypothetical protein